MADSSRGGCDTIAPFKLLAFPRLDQIWRELQASFSVGISCVCCSERRDNTEVKKDIFSMSLTKDVARVRKKQGKKVKLGACFKKSGGAPRVRSVLSADSSAGNSTFLHLVVFRVAA